MSKLPFRIGIHPINWVGEDVKEHGNDMRRHVRNAGSGQLWFSA